MNSVGPTSKKDLKILNRLLAKQSRLRLKWLQIRYQTSLGYMIMSKLKTADLGMTYRRKFWSTAWKNSSIPWPYQVVHTAIPEHTLSKQPTNMAHLKPRAALMFCRNLKLSVSKMPKVFPTNRWSSRPLFWQIQNQRSHGNEMEKICATFTIVTLLPMWKKKFTRKLGSFGGLIVKFTPIFQQINCWKHNHCWPRSIWNNRDQWNWWNCWTSKTQCFR